MMDSRQCLVIPYLILLIVSVSALDTTRVSRIKPNYQGHHPETGIRYTTATPDTEYMNSDHEDKPRQLTTVRTLLNTRPVGGSSLNVRRKFCDKPYSCLNCTMYRLCAPSDHGFVELFSGSCPGDRPYCDNYSGTCVNSVAAAVQCGTPDNSFRCMQDGHFPHPLDSSKYFICSDFKAYGYSCREGFKYYAPSQGCNKFSWLSTPFDCADLNATKVLYNNGGSFFAYCVNGEPYLVNSCAENEFFNTTSQVCEPQCLEDGIMQDSNNCVKYFKCTKNSTTNSYEKVSFKCPSGEGFSNILKKCLPIKQIPNCNDTG